MTEIHSENDPSLIDEPLYKQYTHEVILPATKREVIVTLVGLILFILLLNAGVKWYLTDYTSNRGYWVVREKWELVETIEEPVTWLVVGDSSANQGIVPALLPGAASGGGLNLATQGGFGVFDDVWLTQKYIDRFGPPENILVVHVYDIWHRGQNAAMLAQLPFPQRVWIDYSPQVTLSNDQQMVYWLARYFPLYAENKTLTSLLWELVFGGFKIPKFKLSSDGYMSVDPSVANPKRVYNMTEEHQDFIQRTPFTVSSINQAAMDELVHLADEYDIKVYLALSPLYEGLATDPDFQSYLTEVQAYLMSVADQSDQVYYIPEIITFPVEQLEDVDHVTDPAAHEYTRRLSQEIQKITP
jgi:hypothetical protein